PDTGPNDSQVTKPLDIGTSQVKPERINKETLPGTEQVTPEAVEEMSVKAHVEAMENKADFKAQPEVSTKKANKAKEVVRTSDLTPSQASNQEVDKPNKLQEVSNKSDVQKADLNIPQQVFDQVSSEKIVVETKPDTGPNDS
ncbi:beta/gamma crystallin domain-containing protein 1 isoform X1, partial [Tachysurus ichikawai]